MKNDGFFAVTKVSLSRETSHKGSDDGLRERRKLREEKRRRRSG